jgi:hypothetical protein
MPLRLPDLRALHGQGAAALGSSAGTCWTLPANERSFRELAGLAGQKPWECVGEILEAAACFYTLTRHADWHQDAVVKALKADLFAQYGEERLQLAMAECLTDSHDHHIPPAAGGPGGRLCGLTSPFCSTAPGREATSTRAVPRRVSSPASRSIVTVDSAARADVPDAETIAGADLPAAIAARRFGTIVKSPGVSRYKPVFCKGG